MDLVTIIAAAVEEHAEHSTTPFVVVGLILAAFGVLAGVLGIVRPNLGENVSRAIAAVAVVLVIATMAAMIVIS